jgi:hypothetical protein
MWCDPVISIPEQAGRHMQEKSENCSLRIGFEECDCGKPLVSKIERKDAVNSYRHRSVIIEQISNNNER